MRVATQITLNPLEGQLSCDVRKTAPVDDEQLLNGELLRAWLDASDDLGIDVVAPFTLRVDEQEVHCIALIPDFGAVNGMVVLQGGVAEWEEVRELLNAASKLGYGFSFFLFEIRIVDMTGGSIRGHPERLGIGTETRAAPEWYSGEPWTS